MAKQLKTPKEIRQWNQQIREAKKRTEQSEHEIVAVCLHQQKGSPTLRRTSEKTSEGLPVYICTCCGKKIVVGKSQGDEEILAAIEKLDRALDVIKMVSNPDNEGDQKMLNRIIKTQYRLNTELMRWYRGSKERGNRNRNKNRGQNGDNGGWARPVTH